MTPGFSIQNATKNIILEPGDRNVSAELLNQAGNIISARLKTYGPEDPFRVITNKKQINVQIPDNVSLSEIEGLLTEKGNLGFYETLTIKEIADLSKVEYKARPSEARFGCSTFENKNVVDSVKNILKSVNLLSDHKLFWGIKNSKSMTCLYAVRINPVLTKADIESVNSVTDKESQSITIGIRFKPASAKTWAALTGKNLDKPIAIVIDDKVFFTPVVKAPIENGSCEITGNFTQKEVNYFLALINNDTLPINLTLR
jgi:preprotein translocase subunit SecD